MTPSQRRSATGTFDITSWQEEPYHVDDVAKLGRATLTKTFHGDIVGTSEVRMLAVSLAAGDEAEYQGAAYVAVERLTGTVHGRTGSLVLTHVASEVHGFTVTVVPGSGVGALCGITGELAITRDDDGAHTYALHYVID